LSIASGACGLFSLAAVKVSSNFAAFSAVSISLAAARASAASGGKVRMRQSASRYGTVASSPVRSASGIAVSAAIASGYWPRRKCESASPWRARLTWGNSGYFSITTL
jgi:hypothetical protein